MRFLTEDSFKAPPTPEVRALIPAEQARGNELAAQGLLKHFFMAANNSSFWIVWECASQEALEEIHKTLPLHDYLNSKSRSWQIIENT